MNKDTESVKFTVYKYKNEIFVVKYVGTECILFCNLYK